jgi:protein involved in polysaccharide export with SLBB domain
VLGEAQKPSVLPYKQKMTVLDVMIAVGGLTDFADGNGATIVRVSEGNKAVQASAERPDPPRRRHRQRSRLSRATSHHSAKLVLIDETSKAVGAFRSSPHSHRA